jgi:site-specific DNA-cytosine methylase
VFEATLSEAKRVCNLYLKMFAAQARGGKLPHVSGVVEGDAPERVALLYMRRLFVREFYHGWAGDKSYYEKSRATVEAAVTPEHGATLWSMFTTGCRSAYTEYKGSKEKGAWFENHPSAETPDARRAIARDMAKQVVLNRGLVFDDTDLEVKRILIAAGVRKSPLATAEKHLEDGRPAMDGRYPLLQKLRTIIDATAKGDERAPNSGIFTLSLLKQQTTDLERCVLAILRVESQGGLLEGSKEDVSDAFRLITTAASEFGNIAIGLPGLVYVPLTLAFGMRHSPAAFEVLSRAVEEVYYRSREGSPECWDAVQRFVDDYFLVVNCAEEEDPDARRRNLREAILAVCGPSGLNAEKSTEGRTRLPVFGVFYDLWRRVVYPNHYKVQKFVELARPFVNGEQRYLTLEQAEKLQGLGNFVFQTTPGIMAVFQSRISAMLAKGASAPAKYGGTVPSPALRGESDEQGWRALRCQLRVVCELVKFQESKLLVKPLEAGLRMPQRLCFPGRETSDSVQEYITDAALEGWAGFWNGFYVRGRYSQENNEKFKLAQRRWCEAIGTDSRCINFRELHTAVTLSSLVAPRHPGSIVRFAIDNRAAEAWLSGSTTDLQHVELLITVNSVIQFLLGIDATCRYVRSEDNRFMDVGSRFDREEEFEHHIAEWEKEHGKPVVQLEVPRFLREMGMGGDEVNYESSPEMWQVLAKLMQHWKDMGVGPYKADELDELTAIFHRCGAGEPLSELALVPPEADPVGPSPARIALGEMKLTRASVFRRLVGGLGKTSLPGDVPGRTTLERRDAVLSHQWEKARCILEVPTRCDHRTTFSLPSGTPRPFSGSIRLWENFCGQSTFGKAVEDMNGGRLVGYTETDPYCRTHLGRTFPHAKGLRDHREATARVLRRLKVNLFVTSPPCMEHSSAHTKRRGGRSETGSWYAKCADEAIKAGVAHIIVECTTGVQERNGCAHSPLEGLISALQGSYHVQQIKVDTPTVCSPYNGFVAPVHHTRQYVVATLRSFRKDPMDFDVSAGKVLVHDASAIVGKISLGDKYQAMPESDARQLNRKLRRGGVGRLRNTIQCVARVAGCSETALSEGCFRLRVINPLKGLFTTFTGAVGGDWIVDTLDRRTVVRKPTLPEMAAAYGLRGLERELRDPCEALQSMIGNAVPAPVGDAFVAKVLLDRERGVQQPQCREPFIQGWATVFPAPEPQRLPPAESQELPLAEPCGGRDHRLPRALRSCGRDRAQMAIKGADTPKKPSRGIEKLVNGHGLVNTDLLRRVRQHAGDVMRSGISADSTIRYESSLKGYYEYSKIVGKEPLYGSGWGATAVAESHLAYQQHVVEYLSFLHLVNENKAPTLRSKLSHLSWAHTSTARDDPLKKHQATYVEAWMRALERREPRSAAGKRPATPDMLMMLFMNVSLRVGTEPVYVISIWAAILTAWAFMLRSKEYVAVPGGGSRPMRWKQVLFRGEDGNVLTGGDVASAKRITLRIPSTKNGMQDVTRSIRKTGSGLCCVTALQSLYAGLHSRSDRARTLDPEAPVFIMDLAGTPLHRDDINGLIGNTAQQMYGDERAKAFRSHSLRHGGASAYAAAGVPLHVIKEFGRWQSEAFMVYITLTIDVLDKHMGQVHAQALLLEERKR